MSAGHHHQVAFGLDAAALDRALRAPAVAELLYRSRTLVRDFDMPYIGGYSRDGERVYLDRHLPERILLELDGRTCEVDPVVLLVGAVVGDHVVVSRGHEPVEWCVMEGLGYGYEGGHRVATGAERRLCVMHYGPQWWVPWQRCMADYAKADEHERLTKMPRDYDMRPILAAPVNKALVAAVERATGEARGKKAKAEVAYVSVGRPAEHCGPAPGWPLENRCEHYRAPNSCQLVAGYVSPRGWCKEWERPNPHERRESAAQERAEHA